MERNISPIDPNSLESVSATADLTRSDQPMDVQVFPWSPLLHTGIEIIDEQHEKLVGLLNELASQFVNGSDKTTVLRVIDALAEYAVYHFQTEESIWHDELPTTLFERHHASHVEFETRIEAFRKQTDDPNHLTETLLSYLTEWLAFHILESDRQLAWIVLAIRQGSDYPDAQGKTENRLRSEDGKLSRVIMGLYRQMATTALSLMRSQGADSRLRIHAYEIERAELQQDLLRAQTIGRIGNWKLDLKSQALTWSPETYRLFGVPLGTALEFGDFLANVYEEDRDKVSLAWEAALRGQHYDIEHRTTNSEGQVWVREVAEFGNWEDGVATTAFGTTQNITEEILHEQKLQALAYYDHLTGLPNPHALVQWIEDQMPKLVADKQHFCLSVIDLDGLQQINLSMGREAGDQILKMLAQRLLHESDASYVAHLGADQFALAYSGCSVENCEADRATKLLALIGRPLSLLETPIQLTACIGSVKFVGESTTNAEALVRFANLALYRAKIKGKNTCEFSDFSEHEVSVKENQRIEEIRRGLVEREFTLFGQPKIDLENGNVIGVEALIRWQHPQQGLLRPSAFIPALNFDPLLIELGDWVIDEALAQLDTWQREGFITPISVNVASQQLVHPDFIRKISASLSRHPEMSPENLEIEFLETGPLTELDSIKPVLDQVRRLGVQTSLDDFGTGISSLRVLSLLQMQIIKIDRSFVNGMLERREDLAIVTSSLALGKSLGCKIIAEGVETELEVQKLVELGCRYIQGYVVAKPMPMNQIQTWLAQWRNNPPKWSPWLCD